MLSQVKEVEKKCKHEIVKIVWKPTRNQIDTFSWRNVFDAIAPCIGIYYGTCQQQLQVAKFRQDFTSDN